MASDPFDKFDWWNPGDWFGAHDETSRFRDQASNREKYKDAIVRLDDDDEDRREILDDFEERDRIQTRRRNTYRKRRGLPEDDNVDEELEDLKSSLEDIDDEEDDLEQRRKDKIRIGRIKNDPNKSESEKDQEISEIETEAEARDDARYQKTITKSKLNEFRKRFPQYSQMIRIQEKARRGEDLSIQEANLLKAGRQNLQVDLADKDFVDKVLGMFGGSNELQSDFLRYIHDSPKFRVRREDGTYDYDVPMTIDERIRADEEGLYDDYEKAIEDSEDAFEESDEMLEDDYEKKLDEIRDFEKERRDVSRFYEDRLGISDDLLDQSIQTSRDYASSPSIASETIRQNVDNQLRNRVRAYDATNQRFGSGANIDNLQRDIAEKDQLFNSESAILKMKEQQEKQKHLASALSSGASEKMRLADNSRRRELLDDKMTISKHADNARRILAGTRTGTASRKLDTAQTKFALQGAKQKIGLDNYEKYLGRVDDAQDRASSRNWKLAGSVLGSAEKLTGSLLGGGDTGGGGLGGLGDLGKSKRKKDDEKE